MYAHAMLWTAAVLIGLVVVLAVLVWRLAWWYAWGEDGPGEPPDDE